jgi:5-oxopent-3-ene-1,2,5-tricarboxylate decarboxylase / 2-hydroxyhepta-2,4-diene-1,7-dioate isomerase
MRIAKFIATGRMINGTLDESGEILLGSDGNKYDPGKVSFLPPASPTKIIGLVLNYSDHANELGLDTASEPVLLFKPNNTLLGHLGNIVYPKGATYMHYEAELVVVIGRECRRIKASNAHEYIKGYTIGNDVTVRDFITNTFRPPIKAKGFDTFLPLGPCVVTSDELSDVSNLSLITKINGEIRQQGNTKNLMHSVPELIEFISDFMTLEEDDLIMTGTPKGISPIKPGDKVEISIDNIGTLRNTVVPEGTVTRK